MNRSHCRMLSFGIVVVLLHLVPGSRSDAQSRYDYPPHLTGKVDFRANLRFPVALALKGASGRANVRIELDTLGRITDLMIDATDSASREAIHRALLLSTGWVPAVSMRSAGPVTWSFSVIFANDSMANVPAESPAVMVVRPKRYPNPFPSKDVPRDPLSSSRGERGTDDPVRDGMTETTFEPKQMQGGIRYPEWARKIGLEGAVVVEVYISSTGRIYPYVSISDHDIFDDAALAGIRGTTFTVARSANGTPIDTWVTIPIRFQLND